MGFNNTAITNLKPVQTTLGCIVEEINKFCFRLVVSETLKVIINRIWIDDNSPAFVAHIQLCIRGLVTNLNPTAAFFIENTVKT